MFHERGSWTIECKLHITPNIVCKGILLLTVPLCTVVRYYMFLRWLRWHQNLRSDRNYTDIFPIFYEGTSTSFIDKTKVRMKRFFFITFYPRFYNSILVFHRSILDIYNSILAFLNSILAFYNSILALY